MADDEYEFFEPNHDIQIAPDRIEAEFEMGPEIEIEVNKAAEALAAQLKIDTLDDRDSAVTVATLLTVATKLAKRKALQTGDLLPDPIAAMCRSFAKYMFDKIAHGLTAEDFIENNHMRVIQKSKEPPIFNI